MNGSDDPTLSGSGELHERTPPLEIIGGRYEVERVLGEGAMGQVLGAFDSHLKRAVAIKRIHEEKRNERREKRFLREARVMARLRHPHAVSVYDFGVDDEGALYLVMELVQGESLAEVIRRGPLPPLEAARIVAEVASALAAAHGVEVIHRDVKPDNILVGTHGAKLTDFGIAKDEATSTEITAKGSLVGTIVYMAPEQVHGEVDARSDVYSLGATLYEALVGRPPFAGPRETLIPAIVEAKPVPPREIDPRIPRELERICLRCLEKAPARRFETARDLEAALRTVITRGEPRAVRTWIAAGTALVVGLALALPFSRSNGPVAVAVEAAEEWSAGPLEVACVATTGQPRAVSLTIATDVRATTVEKPFDASGRAAFSLDVPPGALWIRLSARAGADAPETHRTVVVAQRGWKGEVLPRRLRRGSEGLYLWDTGKGLELSMVHVPAGEFFMGARTQLPDDDAASAQPIHRHRTGAYWIGRTEVTWGEYRAFCASTKHTLPADPSWGREADTRPVVNVSWADAVAFCEWAGVRLPTEAEWEKAARGTDERVFPWGNEWRADLANFCDRSCPLDVAWKDRVASDGHPRTSPAGSYPEGASPWKALDMAGNVHEWCSDWFDDASYSRYAMGSLQSPMGGTARVSRGGSWQSPAPYLRCYWRAGNPPESSSELQGFRVAR